MTSETTPNITHVDQVRGGVIITFSDEVVMFYPAEFLLSVRDHEGNCRLSAAEDGY